MNIKKDSKKDSKEYLIDYLIYNLNYDEEICSIHLSQEISTDILADITMFYNLVLRRDKTRDDRNECTLYLSSPGGDLYSTFGIIDLMKYVKKGTGLLTNTIVIGPAFSGATLITICGTGKRSIGANSYMMVHDIWNEAARGGSTATEMEQQSIYLKEMQQRYLSLISEHTNFSMEELKKSVISDIYYNSEQCLEHKMVDEIL